MAPSRPSEIRPGVPDQPVRYSQHLWVVATQRHGKTELLQTYARALGRNYVVIDTCRRGEWDRGWGQLTTDPDAIGDLAELVWQPDLDAVAEPARDGSDPWTRGLRTILEVRAPEDRSGGVTVISDEGLDWLGGRLHPLVRRMVIQGEGRNLGIWAASQSPYGISTRFMGGASHRYVGRLGGAQERGIVEASWSTPLPEDVLSLPQGRFYYSRQGAPLRGPFRRQDLRLARLRPAARTAVGPNETSAELIARPEGREVGAASAPDA